MGLIRRALSLLLLAALVLTLPALAAAEKDETSRAPEWDMTPLPENWFDDAVFIGDSISVTLKRECERNGGLGDALFLCEFSFGVRNAVSGNVKLWYQGKEYFAQDVLPLTGAKKLFLMLGVNDIDLYGGLDRTMEMWEVFYANVHAACPELQFFVESMLPIWHAINYTGLNNPNILVYNDRLRVFCEEHGCVYVDLADYFRDETGGMAMEYSSDAYVHITFDAAKIWIEQLRNPANYSVDPRSFSDGKDAC